MVIIVFRKISQVWMAEQKDKHERARQQELATQYQREQDILSNR